MPQRVRMPTTWAARCALGLAALMATALAGVASAESVSDAPRAVAQPPAMAPLLQTTTPAPTATPTAASLLATPASASASPAASASPTATVVIRDFEFSPARLEIRVGDTVIWSNSGPSVHNAVSVSGVWDTGDLRTGESAYFTFNQPGNYPYVCTIHPRMRGTISVSSRSGDARGPASAFDDGFQMGYRSPRDYGVGAGQFGYYYSPITGNYYASAYPGYPYNLGYGAWWGGYYGYGYPFSYMGGYGYPGYLSANYPYSYYPYSYYGSPYYPYSYYGSGLYYPYTSYYGYPYYSAYSTPYYNYSYYPYGYTSPYASLYYSYYRYPYYSAYGYYPYGSYNYFTPGYSLAYSSLYNYSYLASIYGYQVPYYGTYYGYPYYYPYYPVIY